jgi:protein phosphatase
MLLNIPRFSLVFLIGTSGSGKSTFARKHFEPFEILSSDTFRGWVCNDENALDATSDAFEALYFILKKRLTRKLLTVIDATNLQDSARKGLLEIAKNFHCLSVAFVFHFPEKVCLERNRLRSDRQVPAYVIPQQYQQLLRAEKKLKKEGFHSIHRFETQTALDEVTLVREALWTERLEEKGPFDIIGDVHGCGEELVALLQKLGYTWEPEKDPRYTPCTFSHPQQRRIIFLGDLVDRGPQVPQVLRVAMQLCHQGKALLVPGNHEVKLVKALRGASVKIAHGLEQSLEQIHKEPPAFQTEVLTFLDRLVSHYLLDEGQLVVAHAGMKEDLQGRTSARVRDFALYGETTGEIDEFGLPVRYPWAESYRGKAMVVYGHTPVPSAEWLNHTINIDTGCVFGGELTALRYPEKELVAVKAKQVYFEPLKPFALQETASVIPPTAQQEHDRILHLEDVLGKRILSTRLRGKITLQEENTAAALEAISRFTINPQWLIYLPPTMSPAESSSKESFLEYPIEAFNYYRKQKINTLVCEEKHMGSRAIVVLCQNQETVQRCFGIKENTLGVCYTRRGRPFFEEPQREQEFLQELHRALTESHFWEKFNSSWFALDGEIMPWSAKAQDLLKQQYAAVGAASHHAFRSALPFLEKDASLLSFFGYALQTVSGTGRSL